MPSPSENKAVDLILAAFPGSEVITPDMTKRLPVVDKTSNTQPVYNPVDDKKPPPKKRGFRPGTKKPGKNQEGMF